MTKDDFNAWLAEMGWDRHGGRAQAAAALGVTPETVRKLANGEAAYGRQLAVTMAALGFRRHLGERRKVLALSLEQMLAGDLKVRERTSGNAEFADTTADAITRTKQEIDEIDRILAATA